MNYSTTAYNNLKKIDRTLKSLYGIELNYAVDISEMKKVYEYYLELKRNILQEDTYNTYFSSREYTKALLVMEAVRIFLTEIAPKRKKKNRFTGE